MLEHCFKVGNTFETKLKKWERIFKSTSSTDFKTKSTNKTINLESSRHNWALSAFTVVTWSEGTILASLSTEEGYHLIVGVDRSLTHSPVWSGLMSNQTNFSRCSQTFPQSSKGQGPDFLHFLSHWDTQDIQSPLQTCEIPAASL